MAPTANYMWILLTPAVIALFSAFLLLPWFTSQFAEEMATMFGKLRSCLSSKLDESLSTSSVSSPSKHRAMMPDLFRRAVQLNASYAQASFELRIGRLEGATEILALVCHVLIGLPSQASETPYCHCRVSTTRSLMGSIHYFT